MTLPADNKPENETSEKDKTPESAKASPPEKKADAKADDATTSKALAPAGTSPVNPFVAAPASSAAPEAAAVAPRPFMSRMLDYSAHAAIIVGLIGFAWTVSDHVVGKQASKTDATVPTAAAALPAAPVDEMAQMRLNDQKLHDEIKALKASVETLRATVRHDTTPEQVRVLSAGLDAMKSSLNAETATITQLSGKIDKLQPNKIQQLTDRVGRLEHQTLDPYSTGSITKTDTHSEAAVSEPPRAAPKPPAKPAALASNEEGPQAKDADASEKPTVISGWVVRDVYQGVALIEGKHGRMEIVPGVSIPGAGVVKSIDRKGNGWTVTTTKGQFASAAPQQTHNERGRSEDYGAYGPYGSHHGYPYRYDY